MTQRGFRFRLPIAVILAAFLIGSLPLPQVRAIYRPHRPGATTVGTTVATTVATPNSARCAMKAAGKPCCCPSALAGPTGDTPSEEVACPCALGSGEPLPPDPTTSVPVSPSPADSPTRSHICTPANRGQEPPLSPATNFDPVPFRSGERPPDAGRAPPSPDA
ncbi:MAG: hypothetical protein SFU56_11465 [Capsulimonadales bacterium]|nr:hypothetical protein [Capsulimonadales bacterium]